MKTERGRKIWEGFMAVLFLAILFIGYQMVIAKNPEPVQNVISTGFSTENNGSDDYCPVQNKQCCVKCKFPNGAVLRDCFPHPNDCENKCINYCRDRGGWCEKYGWDKTPD